VKNGIEPGDVILAIEGTTVTAETDLTTLLNGPLERDIRLRVRKDDETTTDVVLRPISYSRARGLLYDKWLEDNRAAVDRLSSGTLGYLHVRGMNWPSFQEFVRQIYAAGFGRKGLIIDVRHNGGGFTTDHLLTVLCQPAHAITVPRGGGPGYPQDRRVYATWLRPIVVLCNQNSFSNAEIFSHAIQYLERGPLVGVPTAGGVISTGSRRIMDLGTIRVPFRGWFTLPDGEDMELNGAVPEHILWPQPGEMPAGKDVQLEKAVEVLQAEVEKAKPMPEPEYRQEK
jgi:tricorn protease